ncbi:MAG: Glycine-tRNA ligase [Candidatus Uhrbacteria bacterium GW2011_GWD2_52_7]|uniref:Glycine-tRNA ligase n=1 Tax=Candidatus Uhrbacteria bacterium GW2011_GWD2_52_7 TaxID=1618989 RepID=A0A0G1ZRB5_9BACT|nr:MAG: Glycine-tRNA ligase [Candidatus Uhrbacteria bacterium GW2011_GWD2_52_7]
MSYHRFITSTPTMQATLEKIIHLSTQKGFVFPSSQIYGGFAATYDFGPLGTLLKKNLEAAWRYWNVTSRTDMVEIEGAIFMHPKTWEASGHIGGFADLLVEDLVTHKRYRADHLIEDAKIVENAGMLTPEQIDDLIKTHNLKSPDGNALSGAKRFNLLVKTHLGPVEDESSLVYLKGESCQNIYLDWKATQMVTRRKLPFGMAQIGKAFRNEITVKQFLFRTREFEQMDVQYFCKPDDADRYYDEWKQNRYDFYTNVIGISADNIRWRQHEEDERAFYAKDAWDVEYRFGDDIGFKEVEGVHHRGSYDLDQHSKFSGEDLSYLDPETNTRFNPFIIECSGGFNRLFLLTLFEHYREEEVTTAKGEKETRVVMGFPYELAPFKVAVLPLMKKDGLADKAFAIYNDLRKRGIVADYDEAGSVGKRYRRQDENGTPWCLTVDYDTLEQGTVTLRHRDSMQQVGEGGRIKLEDLNRYLSREGFGK